MANVAVLASGNGSNFQAIAERLAADSHVVSCLICDKKGAYVGKRARNLGIPGYHVTYHGRSRTEAEQEILAVLKDHHIDLVVLAGFMRLLSTLIVDAYAGHIINIHPSLLPKHPGVNAIEESYRSTDSEIGITIHWVDYGMDTGPVIVQRTLKRIPGETLLETEERIHKLEHETYPEAIVNILDEIEQRNDRIVSGTDRRTL